MLGKNSRRQESWKEEPVGRRSRLAACALAMLAGAAYGDAPDATDKWQYTLFDPVPSDQIRDMETDRPDVTNSPSTIDAGHLQIEIGAFDYVHDDDHYQGANARIDTLDIGHFNFRLGVLNDLELEADMVAREFTWAHDNLTGRSTRAAGFGDLTLGAEFNVWGNDGGDEVWSTGLALQPEFKIPTAPASLGNRHPEQALGIPFQIKLPEEFGLGLQTVVSRERNSADTGYVAGWQNSMAIDHTLFDGPDVYLEYVGTLTSERGQQSQQTLDIGFTWPITDNIMVDDAVNVGLNKATPTIEWLGGFSLRF